MTNSLDIEDLKARASEVSGLLKALSHPNRLVIACDLTGGEKCVSDIETDTGVPQPHLSRELARLREAGLVSDRRASKNVYYSIADQRLAALIDALCDAFGPQTSARGSKRRKE